MREPVPRLEIQPLLSCTVRVAAFLALEVLQKVVLGIQGTCRVFFLRLGYRFKALHSWHLCKRSCGSAECSGEIPDLAHRRCVGVLLRYNKNTWFQDAFSPPNPMHCSHTLFACPEVFVIPYIFSTNAVLHPLQGKSW